MHVSVAHWTPVFVLNFQQDGKQVTPVLTRFAPLSFVHYAQFTSLQFYLFYLCISPNLRDTLSLDDDFVHTVQLTDPLSWHMLHRRNASDPRR